LRFQWIEFDFICIEELTHWTETEFKMLMTSLRTSKRNVKPNFFGSTNPWWIWHGWVKRLWINRDFTEYEDGDEYDFISASVYDNKILLANDPWYLKALEALPEKIRRAYLEGDWDVFEGQFFPEFRREHHVIAPMIPMVWIIKRFVALDYWYSAPSAVYRLAQNTQDEVFCYRETYKTQQTYKQLAIWIKAVSTKGEWIKDVIADPAVINKKSETGGATFKATFRRFWLNVFPWKNSRVDWWNIMREYLQWTIKENWTVKVYITSNCNNLIRTLPELVHDQRNVEDCDTTGEDHWPDAFRYWLLAFWIKNDTLKSVWRINADIRNWWRDWSSADKESSFTKKRRSSKKKWILKKWF